MKINNILYCISLCSKSILKIREIFNRKTYIFQQRESQLLKSPTVAADVISLRAQSCWLELVKISKAVGEEEFQGSKFRESFRRSSRYEFPAHTRARNTLLGAIPSNRCRRYRPSDRSRKTKRVPPLPRAAEPTTKSKKWKTPGSISLASNAKQRTGGTIKRQEVVHATREIININYTPRTRNVSNPRTQRSRYKRAPYYVDRASNSNTPRQSIKTISGGSVSARGRHERASGTAWMMNSPRIRHGAVGLCLR